MKDFIISCVVGLLLLASCGTYNKITFIKTNPISSVDSVNVSKNLTPDTNKRFTQINDTLRYTKITKKDTIINPIYINDVASTDSTFYVSHTISKKDTTTIKPVNEEPKEEVKDPFQKNKKDRNKKITKGILYILGIGLLIYNYGWFLILVPLVMCLIAVISYPKWIKEGYLNTPLLKILVFIAAFGGFIANLTWLILFILA